MKPISTHCFQGVRPALLALALAMPVAHADLVGQWRGTDYVEGQNWTSTPATGSIVANVTGNPIVNNVGYPAGTAAVDLLGTSYFVVPQANNPLSGATEITLVAMFNSFNAGATGGGFHLGSGLIGMEQAGVTNDWGMTWNGNRISGAAPGAGVAERTAFSDPLPAAGKKVAMFTWSAGVQRIYINGVLVRTQNTGVVSPRNAADFALGAATSGGANPFNGEIAELRVYNSDESANAATIANELIDTYSSEVVLEEALIRPNGGRFVLVDSALAEVDESGTFGLDLSALDPVTIDNLQVSKSGRRTTVTYNAAIEHGQEAYFYTLDVPKAGGGTVEFFDTLFSHRLPLSLPGPAGTIGSWGIRETETGAAPLPPNVGDIATASTFALTDPASTEGTAPVLNHADPDTNNEGSTGNFNNTFNVLVNAAGDQNWVVTAKTQVTITTPGEVHTFAVRGDDGFAMRVTGPGGGRFINVGGDAAIDAGDYQTLFRDGGTGDSNSRGTYRFDSAGTYDVTYFGWDGGAGGYHEVAWAPGTFFEDRETNTWRLVGDDTDPSIPAFRERWATNPPGPIATSGAFGVRTYLASGATGLGNMTTFLNTTTRTPENDPANTIDAQLPFLNHRDNNEGAFYRFTDDKHFPGNNPTVNENNVVTVAKGRISIPSTGTYTFITTTDDGLVFRLKGVDGDPDPSFRRVTSQSLVPRFQMSNPNEIFIDAAGLETRGIVDLEAGVYDIEFMTVENVGGFAYELGIAAGEWPHATEPPNGFQLVGVPATTIVVPGVAEPGWTVQTSIPFLTSVSPGGSIANAEARITFTQNMSESDPRWGELGLNPANRTTVWPNLNFRDPQNGPEGRFSPTNPFPLNTSQDDNDYAMKATGVINITQAGTYHLGFQGDDGGYMMIRGLGGLATPSFTSIPFTLHPTAAVIEEEVASSGIFNRLRVEVGTGDSRTLGAVNLEVGQYEIVTLVFEGGGGSWWEVIGGSAAASVNYPLLTTGSGTTIQQNSGLSLVAQPALDPNDPNFAINSIELTGSPITSVSFNIVTQEGGSYTVQASVDLENWIDLDTNVAATGESTEFSVDLADFPELDGEPRVFFRATFNE